MVYKPELIRVHSTNFKRLHDLVTHPLYLKNDKNKNFSTWFLFCQMGLYSNLATPKNIIQKLILWALGHCQWVSLSHWNSDAVSSKTKPFILKGVSWCHYSLHEYLYNLEKGEFYHQKANKKFWPPDENRNSWHSEF